jgi:hypothetical protein
MTRWAESLLVGSFVLVLAGGLAWVFGTCSCELKTHPGDWHVPGLTLQGTPPDHEDAGP